MKTITVKGVGTARVRPDWVVLTMEIGATREFYEAAMREANRGVERLQDAIVGAGFERTDLKTRNFDVDTQYENRKNRYGDYDRVFLGYKCSYNLSLSFDFEMERLGDVLAEIAECGAKPELRISFTVKNPARVGEEILRSAAENARQKAEILCAASGVKLGEIVSIDYNWGKINIESRTRFDAPNEGVLLSTSMPDIEPEDIDACDSVAFVWGIE